ncbi:hypothetical protein [Rhizobium etli]|nr:hypothetical protein [Rhizobium etli]
MLLRKLRHAALLLCLFTSPSGAAAGGLLDWVTAFEDLDCGGFVHPRGLSYTQLGIWKYNKDWMNVRFVYSNSKSSTKEEYLIGDSAAVTEVTLSTFEGYLRRDPITYSVRVTCAQECGSGREELDGTVYEPLRAKGFTACQTESLQAAKAALRFFASRGAKVIYDD